MDIGLVCDQCDTFHAMTDRRCTRCGAALSLDRDAEVSESTNPGMLHDPLRPGAPLLQPPAQAAAGGTCWRCRADLLPGMKFCGECGAPAQVPTAQPVARAHSATPSAGAAVAAAGAEARARRGNVGKTAFFGAMQAARAKLVLIRGDGLDGVSYTLAGEEHVVGRVDGPLVFEDDPYLSPRHSNFFYAKGTLYVRDEDSANGVFVRIRQPVKLGEGDIVLLGEQVLQISGPTADEARLEPDAEGTYYFASPRRDSRLRLVQLLRGGDYGLVFRAVSDVVTLGREGNDINFPDDPFISGHHAQIAVGADRATTLTDLGSKNGTFLKVRGEAALSHGDYVFMGQQLLRVEIV